MLGTIECIGIFLRFFLGFKGLVNTAHIIILPVLPLWNRIVPYDKGVCKSIGSLLYNIAGNFLLFLGRHKPLILKGHNLGKEHFILFFQLGVLFQIGDKHILPSFQAFYLLTIVILSLFFPFGNKRAVRGQGVFVKVFDMGDKVALAVANVKPSFIVEIFATDNSGNLKIGLFIPTDMIILVLTFPMLFFVQNAEQPVSQRKAQIGIAVIHLPVIKGRMFRKANRK